MLEMPAHANIIGIEICILVDVFVFVDYPELIMWGLGVLWLTLAHVLLDNTSGISKALLNFLLTNRQQAPNPLLINNAANPIDAHLIQIIKIKITALLNKGTYG